MQRSSCSRVPLIVPVPAFCHDKGCYWSIIFRFCFTSQFVIFLTVQVPGYLHIVELLVPVLSTIAVYLPGFYKPLALFGDVERRSVQIVVRSDKVQEYYRYENGYVERQHYFEKYFECKYEIANIYYISFKREKAESILNEILKNEVIKSFLSEKMKKYELMKK